MTTVIAILLGMGILLLIASVNNCSIKDTFTGIMAGKPINSLCQ